MDEDDTHNMADQANGVIIVMGVTGAGKSYLLNQLKAGSAREGHSLRSETRKCQAVEIILDDGDEKRSITVVDTPGFDDTELSQADILAEITDFLAAQHLSKLPLRGILYLHKITENRMTKTSQDYLRLLESIVGDDALKNVILVTTMWNTLRPEDRQQAVLREQELLNNFWSPMINKSAYNAQFLGTQESAYSLVNQLAYQESVILDIQKEVVDQDRPIIETATGMTLVQQLERDHEAYQLRLCNLHDQLGRIQKTQPLDKSEERRVKSLIERTKELLRVLSASIERLKVQPGAPMRRRMKQAMKDHGQSAAIALGVVLNAAYAAVNFALGN
ncbi:P-loop containing nucleoside triphosphate hydrolase protein [Fusarium flagelliforme]|uniref:P-loop containing nucleoside triphosphate hydrolase protein n=1 Tax=Fusarium flagelliforme TaxID=2675880 RepID=UPI001E8DE2A0|nr:P-loop containing nucleoside triphosphate hydrolase protein [Fusarium flagelliforme]KAH7174304.1 P-loop containing nucleoside triphosphate hydrolase protein [Fusarium flagelliforme]